MTMTLQQLIRSVARLSSITDVVISTNLQLVRCICITPALERNRKRAPFFAMPPVNIKKLVRYEGDYTTDPLPMERFGGRNEEGKLLCRRGGGDKRQYYLVDWRRIGNPDGTPLAERVLEILDDKNRSAKLAMVAASDHKRYIIATENMKVGDLIRTYSDIPRTPVKALEGDAHPLGALPIGTMLNSVQKYLTDGGKLAIAAGSCAVLVRKGDGRCIVKLPSKRELSLDEKCMATVGRVSNIEHNKEQYGKAGAKRWAGFRPRSGWWQRKDSRFGRKPKRIRPITEITERPQTERGSFLLHTPHGAFPCRRNKMDEKFLV